MMRTTQKLVLPFVLGATALQPPSNASCPNPQPKAGVVTVPEYGDNGVRLWGALEPPIEGPIPDRRDSSDLSALLTSTPYFRDVSAAAGLIVTTTPYGYDLWDVSTAAFAKDPQYLGSKSGWDGDFATWEGVQGEYNRPFWVGDVYDTGDGDLLFVQGGRHGLAIWEIPLAGPNSARLLFQDWNGLQFPSYRDVEIADVGGTLYAFTVADSIPGVQVFDLTAARLLTGCVDDLVGGDQSCGVYQGNFGAAEPGATLGVEGHHLVYADSASQVRLYDLSVDPEAPRLLGPVPVQGSVAEIFRNHLGETGVAVRSPTGLSFYDVSSCVDAPPAGVGPCWSVGVERHSVTLGAPLADRLVVSGFDGRDFVYLSEPSWACAGAPQKEHLYEVSDLGAVEDLFPQATDEIDDGGEVDVVGYSSWYVGGQTGDGFYLVDPGAGAFFGPYFYRAARSLFDVHFLAEPLLVDNFESGDTTAWSATIF